MQLELFLLQALICQPERGKSCQCQGFHILNVERVSLRSSPVLFPIRPGPASSLPQSTHIANMTTWTTMSAWPCCQHMAFQSCDFTDHSTPQNDSEAVLPAYCEDGIRSLTYLEDEKYRQLICRLVITSAFLFSVPSSLSVFLSMP